MTDWDDRAKNKAEELKGTVKERAGEATDNEELEAEGKMDQLKARTKQVGEDIEDAARDAKDALNR
jgi:uncharacterized protein YjbJ (UPF0337 family)